MKLCPSLLAATAIITLAALTFVKLCSLTDAAAAADVAASVSSAALRSGIGRNISRTVSDQGRIYLPTVPPLTFLAHEMKLNRREASQPQFIWAGGSSAANAADGSWHCNSVECIDCYNFGIGKRKGTRYSAAR
jgi:hypothetical protein